MESQTGPTSNLLSTGLGSPQFPTRLEGKEGWWPVLGTTQLYPPILTKWFVPPETLYYEVASQAKTIPRPPSPMRSLGPFQSQVGARAGMWRAKGVVGHLDQPHSSLPLLSAGPGDSAGHGPQQSPDGHSLGLR